MVCNKVTFLYIYDTFHCSKHSESRLCWPHLIPFKPPNLIQVANLWTTLDSIKIQLRTITCANVQFRVQRHVVKLDSWYINLLMNRAL
jgi:hypothetical protein